MTHLIDADKLIAEIEFAKLVYDNPKRVVHGVADAFRQDGRAAMCDDILKKIASLQQEQPMPNSTQLIELWHKDKEMLKEKDFRDDPWRLAYNAFMCGFGRGVAVKRRERLKGESWLETTKKELQHEEELLDMRLETLKHIRHKKNQFQQEQPESS